MSLAAIGVPYIPGWTELRPFIAEMTLICTTVAVLLTPFFVKKPNTACGLVALAGLIIGLLGLLLVGPDAAATGKFAPMLIADPIAFLWKVLLLLFVIGVVVMWFATSAADMHEGDGPEFFVLLLGATTGMAMMASANNLLMILISVELASFPSYVLAGFRKTHRVGAEASLKYVLFGAATAAVMTYGMSLLYGLYGTLNLSELAHAMPATTGGTALLVVSIFALIVGIGFKIAAAPFHFWCPDVFEGASIEVTTFLSVASKGAAIVLLLRVVSNIASAYGYSGHTGALLTAPAGIAVVLGSMGALSAFVGNTAAFVQNNIKRLLAYSSIAHAGYMLCAMSLLLKAGSTVDPTAVSSRTILFYLSVYLFMNLGAFTVAALVYKQTGIETLEGYKGLSRRNPILAACMTACLISFVGLPPFAGFTAKFNILVALVQTGGWWWTLVAVILINTVLSLYFYFRIVRAMYFDSPDTSDTPDKPAFIGNPLGVAISLMCAIMLVVMFIGGNPLSKLTENYGHMQFTSGTTVPATTSGVLPAVTPGVALAK